jgi:hypothetical protein
VKKYEFSLMRVPLTSPHLDAKRDLIRLLEDLNLAGSNGWQIVGHLGLGPESFVMQREVAEE